MSTPKELMAQLNSQLSDLERMRSTINRSIERVGQQLQFAQAMIDEENRVLALDIIEMYNSQPTTTEAPDETTEAPDEMTTTNIETTSQ